VSWLKRVAKCKAALYLDGMGSVGRFVRDCAALRIPCVANSRVDFRRPIRAIDPDYHVASVMRSLEAALRCWEAYVAEQRGVLANFYTAPSRARFEEACSCLS